MGNCHSMSIIAFDFLSCFIICQISIRKEEISDKEEGGEQSSAKKSITQRSQFFHQQLHKKIKPQTFFSNITVAKVTTISLIEPKQHPNQ
ncbi:hypothetical protein QL285_094947 [Trifolium repens]|nr:hypothetical protein QL285_094947 [Trifolium repens]